MGISRLIEALRKWTKRNPANVDQRRELPKKDRLLQARQGQQTKRERIYCGSQSHKVFDCNNCYNSATTAWEKDTEPFLARVKDHVRIAIQSTILQFAKTEMETQHQR